MGQKINQGRYDKFRWFKKWMAFEQTLPPEERWSFSYTIMRYGLDSELNVDLKGEALSYFNEHIKPEIDRQHCRMDKGLEP